MKSTLFLPTVFGMYCMMADTAVAGGALAPLAEGTNVPLVPQDLNLAPVADGKPKIRTLPVDEIVMDVSHNIRDPRKDYSVRAADLQDQIFQEGRVTHRPIFHFKSVKNPENGKVELKFDQIIRGYLRCTAVKNLRKIHPNDRRWETLEVEIYSDLNPEQIHVLKMDTGNQKLLERHEVFRSICMGLDAYAAMHGGAVQPYNDSMVIQYKSYLQSYWPSRKKNATTDDQKKQWRGTVQNFLNVYRCPNMVRDYYSDILEAGGPVIWQRKAIAELMKIFEDERKADLSGTVTKENPGPLALKKWTEILDAAAAAEGDANGDTADAPAANSMSKKEIGVVIANAQSVTCKVFARGISREFGPKSDVIVTNLDLFYKLVIEARFTDEDRTALANILAGDFSKVPALANVTQAVTQPAVAA